MPCTTWRTRASRASTIRMSGKQVRGIERSTFLIGPDGTLVREWRKVKVDGHAQEVLDAVKAL
jgi:thioredoxin-dependent peroxiredoxin